jgi:hypothetical protein
LGGLYRIDTVLLSHTDPKLQRPAVVIALPPVGLPDVRVVTRTSDTTVEGVHHPANPALQLSKDGVFAYRFLRSIDVKYFKLANSVTYLGQLEPPYMEKLVEWWCS